MNKYNVNFTWDDRASVWIATSEDVLGLVLESGSLDALIERTKIAIMELLSLNDGKPDTVMVSYNTKRLEKVAM